MQANIIKRLVHQKRPEEECSGEGDVDEGRSQGVWERAVRGNVPVIYHLSRSGRGNSLTDTWGVRAF